MSTIEQRVAVLPSHAAAAHFAGNGRPLRVCHLGKYYPPAAGGIETHLQTLAQAQALMGLDVEVLCMRHSPGPTVMEMDGPVKVKRFCPTASVMKLQVSRELLRELSAIDADILHMQVPNPTMIVAVLLARPRPPLVVTYQSDVIRPRILRALFRPVERLVYRRVRQIMPTSPPYAEESRFLARYRERIHVVPMGLDLRRYLAPSADVRRKAEELRRIHGDPIWLACGRLIYYKGLVNAIRALPLVEGKLLIVGDGPERDPLLLEAKRLGVADRVVFVGEQPYQKIVPYYLAATAFWFPSNARSEAFGLVQVEAMASGCPVINTAIPGSGVAWVSRHEETGLTIPVDDPEALAAAANRLWSDEALRARLGEAAKGRAERDFDDRVMARKSVKVYESIVTAS